jgi:hypothetical protein
MLPRSMAILSAVSVAWLGRVNTRILFAAAVLLCVGCRTKHYPTAYLSAKESDIPEFEAAFAAEPACHDLKLVKDGGADVRVHYFGTSIFNPNGGVSGYIAFHKSSPEFSGATPQQAVKLACDILKGKGGTVE